LPFKKKRKAWKGKNTPLRVENWRGIEKSNGCRGLLGVPITLPWDAVTRKKKRKKVLNGRIRIKPTGGKSSVRRTPTGEEGEKEWRRGAVKRKEEGEKPPSLEEKKKPSSPGGRNTHLPPGLESTAEHIGGGS